MKSYSINKQHLVSQSLVTFLFALCVCLVASQTSATIAEELAKRADSDSGSSGPLSDKALEVNENWTVDPMTLMSMPIKSLRKETKIIGSELFGAASPADSTGAGAGVGKSATGKKANRERNGFWFDALEKQATKIDKVTGKIGLAVTGGKGALAAASSEKIYIQSLRQIRAMAAKNFMQKYVTVKRILYPHSGTDGGMPFFLVPNVEEVVAVDHRPMFSNTISTGEKIKVVRSSGADADDATIAETGPVVVGFLAQNLDGFRIRKLIQFTTLDQAKLGESRSTRRHTIMEFDRGEGTLVHRYVHLQLDLAAVRNFGKSNWWAGELAKYAPQLIIAKGNEAQEPLRKGSNQGRALKKFILGLLKGSGALLLEGDEAPSDADETASMANLSQGSASRPEEGINRSGQPSGSASAANERIDGQAANEAANGAANMEDEESADQAQQDKSIRWTFSGVVNEKQTGHVQAKRVFVSPEERTVTFGRSSRIRLSEY